MIWSKALKSHLLQKYGDYARFIDEDRHYEPAAIEFDDALLGADADPMGYISLKSNLKMHSALKRLPNYENTGLQYTL